MKIAGISPKTGLVEIIELTDHPWFLGCQFHPEFQSRPMKPHQLFVHFIRASVAKVKRNEWTHQKAQTSEVKTGKQEATKAAK